MQRPDVRHMPEPVRVWLLGGFRVSIGSRTIDEGRWRLKKAAALVKLLALTLGHRLHREQVLHVLWPELGKRAASNNLRQALHAARKALASDPSEAGHLTNSDESLVLCPKGRLWVDVDAFEEAAASARRTRDPAAYRVAIELYAGELLPEDRYEEWSQDRRESLRRLYLELLAELAGLYEEGGKYWAALEVRRRLVVEEPTNEEAQADLMRAYALSDRPKEALDQYERLRETLFARLATEPTATTRHLHAEISTGRFSPIQRATTQPDKQLSGGKHNLPPDRTNFLGREREIIEVKRRLAMTDLLTLTGPGGSGKTRLALEVAKDLVGAYPDGVWLVELVPLSEGELIAQEVAATLGVREQPGRPFLDILLGAMRDRETLLILDNCEHLIETTRRFADALLDSCPRVRVLATSREPLGVRGEFGWLVPPLSVPVARESLGVEELEGFESARLFADRAASKHPGFEISPENAAAVARVCAGLEGIPLAIELAAARVGLLSVEQISERLGYSLKLLTGGKRTADPRHRTLGATLDWSYELLGGEEQALFRRLSVFSGGFTLEAAESVGLGGGIEEDDVLELLPQLVDKSLVVADESWEGGARHRLLEPIRQYAWARLEESGESNVVRRGHSTYFLTLAETEPELKGAQQGEWLERLEAEHDNLRVALSWSLDRGEARSGLHLVAALWWFWYARGYLSEGRRWLEAILPLSSDSSVAQPRAWALNGAGWIALFQGDFDAAKTLLERALALFRELGDKEGIASSLANLGFVAMLGQREDIPVPDLLGEARELRPGLRNRRTVAYLLLLEGVAAFVIEGNLSRARKLHQESLALLREVWDLQGVGGCLFNMGLIELAQAGYSRATQLFREALNVAREADDKNIIQLAFFGLANVAARRGRPVRAARLWGASENVREAFDMQLSPGTRYAAGYEDNLSTARARLGGAVFEEAWDEGKTLVQQQTLEYALSEEESGSSMRLGSEQAPAGEPAAKLTHREQEVAGLVTRGLTNRQISTALGISERTAGNHVARVLRKLGLRSRTQIASWATERQLPAPDPD